MEFKIDNYDVYDLKESLQAAAYSYQTEVKTGPLGEKDILRGEKLGPAKPGTGHNSFLKGITVCADITAPLYWWKQFQRYHFADIVSSTSTMHTILKMHLDDMCVKETNIEVMQIVQKMIDRYNKDKEIGVSEEELKKLWRSIIASCPSGLCLTARITTNYLQLQTMWFQRHNHVLDEWHIFCAWAETLPYFEKFTGCSEDEKILGLE